MPVVYPFKFVMPVAGVLLLLQGISELLRAHPCGREPANGWLGPR